MSTPKHIVGTTYSSICRIALVLVSGVVVVVIVVVLPWVEKQSMPKNKHAKFLT